MIVEIPDGERSFGRPRHRWEEKIKILLRFEDTRCRHFGAEIKKEAACSVETLVHRQKKTWRKNAEDHNVNSHRDENIKSYMRKEDSCCLYVPCLSAPPRSLCSK
jgi:hypothetical protein